ncbi:MAG: tRNA pseudouridine(38-40) synthase TruA [Bacteroides sp.]|nr:tRNA pseudouridine(38-40) synthase TruA [Bacteroides sp.]
MGRWFMRLSYNGAPYHGWQSQPGGVATVQSALEDALSKVLRHPTAITGAGRTDTGVNARMMVAHFDVPDTVSFNPTTLPRALGAITGPSIVVESVWPVADDMHARFSATSRTYHYYALTRRSPFFNALAWAAPPGLDYDAMNRSARILLETDDFTSFSKLHTDTKTNICRVTRAEWMTVEGYADARVFVITADRFLRNMVRAVVGTLVDVGRGKITEEQFRRIIQAKDRCAAGTSMPPQALYLWDITYPE